MYYNKISAVLSDYINKHSTATNDSKSQYKAIIKQFGKWVKDTHGTERVNPEEYHSHIQAYINSRMAAGKTAQTVNKDLAALVAGTGESKKDYQHPKRNQAPIKGRATDGIRTEHNARIFDIAPFIGIRENEYRGLKGGDLRVVDGDVFVYVRKGKGGKRQMQLCDPAKAEDIKRLFDGKGKDEHIFSLAEIQSADKANLHAKRRAHAKAMYNYYMCLPEKEKKKWMERTRQAFECNPNKKERKEWAKVSKRIKEAPLIVCRGHNKRILEAQGRSIAFNREAVVFVSVWCLAHYREGVTVNNYLV